MASKMELEEYIKKAIAAVKGGCQDLGGSVSAPLELEVYVEIDGSKLFVDEHSEAAGRTYLKLNFKLNLAVGKRG